MPEARHSSTAAGTVGRVRDADKPQKLERKASRVVRPRGARRNECARYAEHAHALPRHFVDCVAQPDVLALGDIAELGDGFWRAFCSGDQIAAIRLLPHIRDCQQFGTQAIFPFQHAVTARLLIGRQSLPGQRMERFLHRVERLRRARENAMRQNRRVMVRQPAGLFAPPKLGASPHRDDCHPVLGQRASLVGAEHRRGAERLDRGNAPGQHASARDPPGAHHHEHGQYKRKFLGQHRHAEGDAAQ